MMERIVRRYGWLALAFAITVVARPAHGFDTGFQACFNPSGGWGVAAPVIDGILTNESGWARTFQYRFQNGAADSDVRLLATSAGTKLYVAVEVKGDVSYDALDTVLLAFQSGTTWYRVIVHPFPNTSAPTGPAFQVFYDRSTSLSGGLVHFGGTPHAVTPTAGVETTADDPNDGKFRVWTTASGISSSTGVGSWTTEIAIPLGDGTDELLLPSGTDLGMYAVVSRTMSPTHAANPPTNYYSWPHSLWSTSSALDLDHDLPNPASWGVARIGSASTCNGLSVAGVRTLDPENMADEFALARTQNNAFRLTVNNTSVDAAGTAIAVTGVTAKFSVGLWGVPLSWRNVASSTTPVTVAASATGVTIDSGFSYIPSSADLLNDHVCLLGEVETTQGVRSISQKSIIINTRWGPASTFVNKPIIQASLLKPEPGVATTRLLLRGQAQLQFAFSAGEIPEQGIGNITAQASWRFDAYHVSGRTLVVNGVRQPLEVPIGTFVEIVRHQLAGKFGEEFAARHEAQRKQAFASVREQGEKADPDGLQRARYRAFNALLADDQEQPAATSFGLEIKGMSRVEGASNVYQVDLPIGKDLSLTAAISYLADGNGGKPPGKLCGTCNFGSGRETVSSLVLLIAVVLIVRRRRAR